MYFLNGFTTNHGILCIFKLNKKIINYEIDYRTRMAPFLIGILLGFSLYSAKAKINSKINSVCEYTSF